MKTRVLIAALIAALVPVLAVPTAGAHLPGVSVTGLGTPTIDGVMSPGEWADAGRLDFAASIPPHDGGGTTPATLFVMNDESNLYFGLRVARQGQPRGSFVIEFDNDHDGIPYEEGHDGFVANPATAYFDFYRTTLPPCSPGAVCGLLDTGNGGTSDGRSAAAGSGGVIVYEVSKPLDSADDTHDFSLGAGQTVGFTALMQVWSLVPGCNFGFACVAETNVPAFGGGDIVVAAHDTTAPALTVPAGISADATGPGGAVVLWEATATDETDGSVPVTCTPSSGSTFAIGSTGVTCTASDTAGNEASASFTVTVLGAADQLGNLIELATGVGPGSGLADKLTEARNAVLAGDQAEACSKLVAFVNQVEAQSGKKLTETQAEEFVAAAERIRDVLAC